MNWTYKKVLAEFTKKRKTVFTNSQHGLEREYLRITKNGEISQEPHPKSLGAALTNPFITTDFSEAQLELITPPLNSEEKTLEFLKELHLFIKSNSDDLIWPLSMPDRLPKEKNIPIAKYGRSPLGDRKTQYRIGLEHRYGRKMQTVSGTHYNFSFSEELWDILHKKYGQKQNRQNFISESYLHLIRNFLRYSWLNTYLFGASPTVDKTYLTTKPKFLKRFGWNTFYGPYATSFRLSSLGYYSKIQSQLAVSFNNLESYIKDLKYAISTPSPKYKDISGLNDHILQMENEHYSRIRPKTFVSQGETPLSAMEKKGIKYVEARAVDIYPYSPIGVEKDQLYFLHIFLIYCLFKESKTLTTEEQKILTENQNKVAVFGRDPNLKLNYLDKEFSVRECSECLTKDMLPVAQLLDKSFSTTKYTKSLDHQLEKIKDSSLTPSAKILNDLFNKRESHQQFGLRMAKENENYYKQKPNKRIQEKLKEAAGKSLIDQEKIEIKYDFYLYGYEDLELSTQLLIREALKRNINVDVLDREASFIKLSKGKKVEYIRQATKTSQDNYVGMEIMGNKHVSKQVLNENGIRVPEGDKFSSIEKALNSYERFKNKKIVIKPTTTNYGIGVFILEPNKEQLFKQHVKDAFKFDDSIIIEEFIEGEEYRFLVIGDKVVSIVNRVAAHVIGDGKHNIKQLVQLKNDNYKVFKNPNYIIRTGADEKETLKEQGLTFNSIPKKGQKIFLRKNSNISTGGEPIEVSDKIDEKYKEIAVKAVKSIGGKICGIDMIIGKNSYGIIETNYNPSLYAHEALVGGERKNTPKAVLDFLGF